MNKSTESADEGGCLKCYRPLALVEIYAEIKTKATYKQITNSFVNCKMRAESQACAIDIFNFLQIRWLGIGNILMKLTGTSPITLFRSKRSFSVFRMTVARVTFFTQRCRFGAFYWSIHICPPILYSMWLKSYFVKFEVFFGFVYLFAIYKHQSLYLSLICLNVELVFQS